jgi:hypothetical protein
MAGDFGAVRRINDERANAVRAVVNADGKVSRGFSHLATC